MVFVCKISDGVRSQDFSSGGAILRLLLNVISDSFLVTIL